MRCAHVAHLISSGSSSRCFFNTACNSASFSALRGEIDILVTHIIQLDFLILGVDDSFQPPCMTAGACCRCSSTRRVIGRFLEPTSSTTSRSLDFRRRGISAPQSWRTSDTSRSCGLCRALGSVRAYLQCAMLRRTRRRRKVRLPAARCVVAELGMVVLATVLRLRLIFSKPPLSLVKMINVLSSCFVFQGLDTRPMKSSMWVMLAA